MFDTWRQVRISSDAVAIVPGRKRLVLASLFITAGVALGIGGYHLVPRIDGFGLYSQFLCGIFGIALVTLGLAIWRWRATIAWRPSDRIMEISLRGMIHRRQATIAAADLAVELVLFGALDSNRYTQTGVRLRLREADEPPVVVFSGRYSRSRPLFELLATIVPEAADRTRESAKSDNASAVHDTTIEVTRAPLGKIPGHFQQTRGNPDTPNVLTFRLEKKLWLVSALCLLVGGMALHESASMHLADDGAGFIVVVTVGTMFFSLGLFGVYVTVICRITVDLSQQVIKIGSLILGRRPRTISFSDVYALQLCTMFTHGGESPSLRHELNLVLARPRGQRIALMSNETVRPLREQAKQLGEIMAKPVLDHSNQDWPGMSERAIRMARKLGFGDEIRPSNVRKKPGWE